MNTQEISNIFALFMLVYPEADVFKGTPEEMEMKMDATMRLWADLFKNELYSVGLAAAKRVLLDVKFMPKPAEYATAIIQVKKDFAAKKNSLHWELSELIGSATELKDLSHVSSSLTLDALKAIGRKDLAVLIAGEDNDDKSAYWDCWHRAFSTIEEVAYKHFCLEAGAQNWEYTVDVRSLLLPPGRDR